MDIHFLVQIPDPSSPEVLHFRRGARVFGENEQRLGDLGSSSSLSLSARKQSKIAQGLGGVKRRKRSRRPPRNASCRMWVRGDPGRVGVEMLKLRASAARSGTGMGSVGCRWSETVAHASARRKTSYEWPPGSGTRWVRVAKAARECGVLGNARDERTSLSSKIRGKKSAIRNLRLQ
ncbi:hypothetical protein EDB83DRAFT_323676 [Lactarius deliciosus]|nr:hypothetical protein EDB83DRAFT_323676 [Lactarius deliciosus]